MTRIAASIALLALAACTTGGQPRTVPTSIPTAAPPEPGAIDAALAAIDADAIRAHVRFLASDLLEGRAPGTRGGELAAEYIAAQFETLGLEPVNGSYLQRVPIVAITADADGTRLAFRGARGSFEPAYLEDYVAWTLQQRESAAAAGEVVFVGFGVNAPGERWDDYAGVDVRGKVAMILVNDPPATAAEPELFGDRAMTYYGRWTYKLEEAERQGAAAVILVHTEESASYDWSVVTGSWGGEQYQLPLQAGRTGALAFASWLTQDAARRLLALGGHDLDALTEAARRRGFRAVPTGVRADAAIRSTMRRSETANVVGLLRGETDEAVVYGGHYDHLGIGTPVDGDSIFNGALDNASGIGVILEIADGFRAVGRTPRRSVLFVAIAAEESGLLGAQYFVENPVVPVDRMAANLNIDMTHFFGPTEDIEQLGGDRSTLGADLDAVLGELGMRATGDPRPEAGIFFRSDHFPFAKAGVPALYFKSGTDVVGRPEGWGAERLRDFLANRYHKPADEILPEYDFRTGEQLAEIAFRLGWRIANAERAPEWFPGSEFQRR